MTPQPTKGPSPDKDTRPFVSSSSDNWFRELQFCCWLNLFFCGPAIYSGEKIDVTVRSRRQTHRNQVCLYASINPLRTVNRVMVITKKLKDQDK